jgi:hypothetical protein
MELPPDVRKQHEVRLVELFRTTCGASDGTAEDYFLCYREGLLMQCIVTVFMIAGLDISDAEAQKTLPVLDATVGNMLAAVDDLNLLSLAKEILGEKKTN